MESECLYHKNKTKQKDKRMKTGFTHYTMCVCVYQSIIEHLINMYNCFGKQLKQPKRYHSHYILESQKYGRLRSGKIDHMQRTVT